MGPCDWSATKGEQNVTIKLLGLRKLWPKKQMINRTQQKVDHLCRRFTLKYVKDLNILRSVPAAWSLCSSTSEHCCSCSSLRQFCADMRADRLQSQEDGWPHWELPDRFSFLLNPREAGRRIDFHLFSGWWQWNRYQGWCCEERSRGGVSHQGVKRRKECTEITGRGQTFMMEKVRVAPEMWSQWSGKKWYKSFLREESW